MTPSKEAVEIAREVVSSAIDEQRIMLDAGGYGGSNSLILTHVTKEILPLKGGKR